MKQYKKHVMATILMGVVLALGLLVAVVVARPAHADSGTATSTVTAVVFKSVNLKGKIVVTDEHIRVGKKHGCQTFKTFQNSSNVVGHKYHGSKRVKYIDHNGLLCRDKHSPTGWVKRGGGATGRDCGNIAAPMHHKMPYPMVKHVVDIHSMLKVYVTVSAHAEVHESCGNASGDATASDWISVSFADYIRSRSNMGLREQLAASVVVKAEDSAVAKASVTCSGSTTGTTTVTTQTTTTTTTTTPTTTTTVPPPSITITSFTNLNQVPAGKNSGPAPFTVNVSDPGGSVTVSPDLGGISACNSSTPLGSVTFNLSAGNNNECVIYYAPDDADQPPSDTITYTATVHTAGGTAKDVKTDIVDITYPVRP